MSSISKRVISNRRTAVILTLTLAGLVPGSAAGRTWRTDLAAAKAEAAQGDRLIVVDLFAEWCGWCKVLERDVFSREAFLRFAADKVLLRLDVEDGADGSRIQSRFEVFNLPTTLILDADEVLVGQIEGMAPEGAYLARMRGEILAFEQLQNRYEEALTAPGKRATEDLRDLAESFHRRGDGERAAMLYRTLEQRGWQEPQGAALLPFRLADALRLAGRYEEAAAAVQRARRLAAGGSEKILEAIDLLGIKIAEDLGDCQSRRVALQTFLDAHPESSLVSQVNSSLSALESGADGSHCS